MDFSYSLKNITLQLYLSSLTVGGRNTYFYFFHMFIYYIWCGYISPFQNNPLIFLFILFRLDIICCLGNITVFDIFFTCGTLSGERDMSY